MRFSGFRELVDVMSTTHAEKTALVHGDGCETVSWSSFAHMVRDRARELAVPGATCEGIVTDGSLPCVTEVFAANRFFQDLVDKFASESFDAELELTIGLLVPFFLFAAASVAVILLATHWGKNKMKEDASF